MHNMLNNNIVNIKIQEGKNILDKKIYFVYYMA